MAIGERLRGAWSKARRYIGLLDQAAGYDPLKGLTPYKCIWKIWASEPKRFTIVPTHQMPGLNN
jgi:hypothetical protein